MWKPLLYGAVLCGTAAGLADHGEPRAFLGAALDDVPRDGGIEVQVNFVQRPSPAAEAKIQERDFIIKFDGTAVTDSKQLKELIRSRKPGDRVIVTVQRAPREQGEWRIPVVLGETKTK